MLDKTGKSNIKQPHVEATGLGRNISQHLGRQTVTHTHTAKFSIRAEVYRSEYLPLLIFPSCWPASPAGHALTETAPGQRCKWTGPGGHSMWREEEPSG